MRVSASVKKICRNCKIIRRKGVVRVICTDRVTSSAKADSQSFRGRTWHVSLASTFRRISTPRSA